jgi:hypothetical protein
MRYLYMATALTVLLATAACNKDETPTSPTPTPTSGAVIGMSGNLSFGSVTVGATATSTLTISNTGTAALEVTGVTYPAGFSGNFTSGTIAPSGTQAVTVTFTPTAATAYAGNITVAGNQASGTNTIAVSGTGAGAVTFTLSGHVTESAPTISTLLAGAVVTIIDGANQGKTATAGADGRYQITGVVNGGYTITATLAGYGSAALPVGIDGNTTFDIRLNPLAARTRFGPGQYRVGADMPAGLYYSDPGHGCSFRRLQGFGGTAGDAITTTQLNFDAGQWVIRLLPTDAGFSTDASCGFWHTTPRRGLEANITAGAWAVGTQVTAGTYRAESASVGCEWQRLSDFTASPAAVIASAFVSTASAQIVTIASTDAGFSSTSECGTWVRTGGASVAARR